MAKSRGNGKALTLEIDGWDGHITLSYAHFVEAPQTPCVRLHGHSGAVSLRVEGSVGIDGFVVDFGAAKRRLRAIVDALDHHALVPKHLITSRTGVWIRAKQSGKDYTFPVADVVELPVSQTTAEELSQYVLHEVMVGLRWPGQQLVLRKNLMSVSIRWDEGRGTGVWASWRQK